MIAGGEFKRALPLAEDALERSLLELKDNEVSSAKNLAQGLVCGMATQLARVKSQVEGRLQKHLLEKHCFANFQYPNGTALVFQADAATLLLADALKDFNWQNIDLSALEEFATYSQEILGREEPGNPFLSPFAFAAILYSDNRDQQFAIREKFLTP